MTIEAKHLLRKASVGSAMVLGVSMACAQLTSAQTLAETLATAYATNPTLAAARAQLRAVNELVPQALSSWRPALAVTGSVGKQRIETEASFFSNEETTTPIEAAATLVQPLYRGGRTVAATERAQNTVRAQRSILQSVEQSVMLRAVTAHMDVWRDQAVLELSINNEKVLERHLEATQHRFTAGELTLTDVDQSETRLAVATAGRIAAKGALTSSRAVYKEVVGSVPGVLQPPPPLEGLPANLDEVINLAVSRNPDVLAARFLEKAARRRVRETLGELLPIVQLIASLRHTEEINALNTESDRAQIAAVVTVPLYQQGAVSSRVREAKQISNQRRIEIEEARRRTEQNAISSWEGLQTARAQIGAFESGVRSAESALKGVEKENAVGARTVLDVFDAEQELLNAHVNLVRSNRNEIVAEFRILAVVGRLTARDLKLAVEVYDPEIDYRRVRNLWFGLGDPLPSQD